MNILISLDAGSLKSGLSHFHNGVLVWAQLVSISRSVPLHARINAMANALVVVARSGPWGRVIVPAHFVAEWPRIYPGRKKKNPKSILPVVGVITAFRALFGEVASERYPAPSDWKQTRPKEVIMSHIFEHLSPAELKVIQHPKNSDCVEAVGIGLWALNRL